MKKPNSKLPWLTPFRVIVLAMLAWALVPSNPYAYYVLLRWFSCGVFVYLAVAAHKAQHPGWLLLFVINAGIYNPIIRVHLGRPIWSVVNVLSIFLGAASFQLKILSKEKTDV
jgi:hypothetical protein